MPQTVDFRVLGEEPMRADVKPCCTETLGSCQTSGPPVPVNDDDAPNPVLTQFKGSPKPGGASA
jgi:hypothetical protein